MRMQYVIRACLWLLTVSILLNGNVQASEKDYIEGVNLFSAGDYQGAIPRLKSESDANPKNHDATYRLAIAYEKVLKYEDALKTYARLDRYKQLYPNLHFAVAHVLYTLKRYDEAEKHFAFSERNQYKLHESRYFRGFIHYIQKRPDQSRPFFTQVEKESPEKDIKQGASLYLGLILFDAEKPEFEKNVFVKSKKQFGKCIEIDPNSTTAENCRAKLQEIARLLGEDKRDMKRLSASLSQDVEYDTNVLNENDNTVSKTDAKAYKFNTIGSVKYQLVDINKFYFNPELNMNLTRYLAESSGDQNSVKKSDSFIATGIFNLGSPIPVPRFVQDEPIEVAYPVKTALTVNDSDGDDVWKWYTIAFSLSPSFKYKPFGLNYTTFSGDYTYTLNATESLSTQSVKGSAAQTYNIFENLLDATFSAGLTWTWMSNDKAAINAGTSLIYKAPWSVTISPGFNYTFTKNVILHSRGNEHLMSATLDFNRVFFDLVAANIHYTYENNNSGLATSDYFKHKIGFRATISY